MVILSTHEGKADTRRRLYRVIHSATSENAFIKKESIVTTACKFVCLTFSPWANSALAVVCLGAWLVELQARRDSYWLYRHNDREVQKMSCRYLNGNFSYRTDNVELYAAEVGSSAMIFAGCAGNSLLNHSSTPSPSYFARQRAPYFLLAALGFALNSYAPGFKQYRNECLIRDARVVIQRLESRK